MTSRTSRFVRTAPPLMAAVSALVAPACRDAPVAPDPPPAARVAVPPDQGVAFAAPLDDARRRILPALEDAPGADALRRELDALAAALAAGDRRAVARTLGRGDAELTALADVARGGNAAAAAPELDAVRLILLAARSLADRGAAPPER